MTTDDFARNLAEVRARMDAACARAGRTASEVRLLAVSKTVPAGRLRSAYQAGYHEFGENKVQEAVAKATELADLPDLTWAMIGHLQTNKVREVVSFADEFHALDSLRLAEALERRLESAGRSLDVYLEVNTSGEPGKFGLLPDQVAEVLAELPRFPRLRPVGLMTLAVNSSDATAVRACFAELRELRDRLQSSTPTLTGLSMGMSGDFELAIEEGATTVRIGQALFGARTRPA
ncbi:MAG: YggS family pyridoxal phosphate-dependent enzyme [Propionicimonas sp.]|nr:YggS family pyridoxal phosphate-dependent enzyme [Propionicimonas sp.]MEA4945860.1 YggS family pyridoxal phosphate-dependent enzyme [Propionicimonas sp.]MEA5117644.1 YggS family pyridoxal phosphate-dependent enzyme [Propionicimonas sp.]